MTTRIRLLPLETPPPTQGYIPFRHARGWRSDAELADAGQPAVTVFLTQKAYVRANVHAQSDLENEVGGWLIGVRRADQLTGEEYIVIERCLPALFTRQGSAYLTFTQDSQVAMFGIMEEKFPDKDLLGWYHTHPKMGVFLSSYDLFLHNHFFPHPWQVALVIEPHSSQAGFFIRDRDGYLDGRHYYGFHELSGGMVNSVVRWTNMEQQPSQSAARMESEHE
ncbi:MAG: Mov34/MPN/PAD-1 family protein [Anaerolineales bacterium]|jgi:proteasome lid subunit RPN8/RPN11